MYNYAFSLTLSWAWILAPFSTSSATTSEWPLEAAAIRGVLPSYQTSDTKRDSTNLCTPYKDTHSHLQTHTKPFICVCKKIFIFSFILCSYSDVCQVTSLAASMAAPACRSRKTTSLFPTLAALINKESSFSC